MQLYSVCIDPPWNVSGNPSRADLCPATASTPAYTPSGSSENAPAIRRQGEVNAAASYWLEGMQRQGIAAFNKDPTGYKVFRNVKDYGARGGFAATGSVLAFLTGPQVMV